LAAQKKHLRGPPPSRREHRSKAAMAGEKVGQPDHRHHVCLECDGSGRPGRATADRQPVGVYSAQASVGRSTSCCGPE
jgi:hypothetical protein